MIAQQLTPELMQPSVLVEIDHGPPVGLHQQARDPEPGRPQAIPETSECNSILDDVSVSTSNMRLPIESDGSSEPGLEHDGNMSIGVESDGTGTEVLQGANFMYYEDRLTSRQPFWRHDFVGSKFAGYHEDTGKKEAAVTGANKLAEGTEWKAASPCRLSRSSGTGLNHLLLAVRAASRSPSTTTCLDRGFATDLASSQGDPRSLLLPWDERQERGALLRKYTLMDWYINGNENLPKRLIANEKKMVEADKSFLFELPKNALHVWTKTPGATYRGADPHSQLPMAADTEDITREIFMWMLEYNLVSYSAPETRIWTWLTQRTDDFSMPEAFAPSLVQSIHRTATQSSGSSCLLPSCSALAEQWGTENCKSQAVY